MKAKKRDRITVWTPIIEAKSFEFIESLKETKKVKADKINTHNKSEPSWLPHTPLILYINGFKVCELLETINREKSDVIKLYVKINPLDYF